MPTIEDYESAKRLLRELKRLNKQEAATIENVRARYSSKLSTLLADAPAAVRSILDETLSLGESLAATDPSEQVVSPRLLTPVEPLPPGAIIETHERRKGAR